jgi:hypothetical protein
LDCGDEIRIKDLHGSYAVRFIGQCHGGFLVIAHADRYMNGYRLASWQAALRELVALAVPAALVEKMMTAESTAGGRYNAIPLSYPLSAAGLAGVLGVPAADVLEQLADLAVPTLAEAP